MEKKDNDKQQSKQSFDSFGCLYIIVLAAVACMAIKGCKMVDMKYQEQKIKHEMIMDSLNTVKK